MWWKTIIGCCEDVKVGDLFCSPVEDSISEREKFKLRCVKWKKWTKNIPGRRYKIFPGEGTSKDAKFLSKNIFTLTDLFNAQ